VADAINNTVGEYHATTVATVNSSFITGLKTPIGIALDALGHLIVTKKPAGPARWLNTKPSPAPSSIPASFPD
jgi:hypothetical protein